MLNLREEVVSALEKDVKIIYALGGKRIYHLKAPKSDEYPRITFFELMNIPSYFADDQTTVSEVSFQISIWSRSSNDLSDIGSRVAEVMESLGFIRTFSMDIYEDDTKIFHRPMRFKTKREGS
ncbi:DUF3168 domain-containing protein [Thermoactinomyces sp. DSM 45892]|uniref:tail completion protein gp17 n=1 Tax=Thermoactinomyces sp. DSM 45892 TaxID=1882753 RepID=UPI00089D24BE|nr:DUF3168 domain-containing protein [Thermoactinomyces sp. DSM 45892]SDY69487.1 Protein of unknown function [Thermoactinomyces sp. DSM 45892]